MIPRSYGDPVVGEKYFVEASAGIWSPGTEMDISSESLGIAGDVIDFKKDLGLVDHSFKGLHLILRPGKKHKFRYQFIPIKFTQSAIVPRQIVFNGQKFTANVPVNSQIDWRTHRFGYEYDFVSLNRGYGGIVLDVKQTDVVAYLESPLVTRQTAHGQAPVPSIGGTFRAYVWPNISITGEIVTFRIPKGLIKNTEGHYLDVDFYGTFNFTRNVGAQLGFRRYDLGYIVDKDFGDFELKGLYFSGVVRY